MQQGRPQVLSEVARQLGADVLVQVQAHPTKQTQQGLEVRIIAEAMNTRDGQSLARAVVDVPPPLDKPQINEYTRFLARKLMDQMTETWSVPPPPAPPPPPAASPQESRHPAAPPPPVGPARQALPPADVPMPVPPAPPVHAPTTGPAPAPEPAPSTLPSN